MAISLNNHEDRLQSIERRDWWRLTDNKDFQIPQGTTFVEVCRFNPNEVKMIFIYFTFDYQTSSDPHRDGTVHMTILPAGKEFYACKIWPVSDIYSDEEIWIKIEAGIVYMCTYGSNTADNVCMTIYGFGDINKLKLYYNFSYNIYRLANSISFHFFKCLINSFKGGVKEIWQLV